MKAAANGIETYYEMSGPPSAPVIVFSHSLAADHTMWGPQIAEFQKTHRVLAYDTRGHGRSEVTPPPYSLELLAADLVGLLDALGIGKVDFVGLSMGGMIGQVLGLSHADRVRSLVLCDCNSRVPPELRHVFDDRIRVAETQGMAAAVDSTISRWFTEDFARTRPEIVQPIRATIERTSPTGYAGCCHALRELNLTSELHRIKTPTLLVVGDQDMRATVAAHEEIQREIAGSRLVVLSPAAHLSSAEQPEAFNQAVREFLASIEA